MIAKTIEEIRAGVCRAQIFGEWCKTFGTSPVPSRTAIIAALIQNESKILILERV
jgi:hypothetical protein